MGCRIWHAQCQAFSSMTLLFYIFALKRKHVNTSVKAHWQSIQNLVLGCKTCRRNIDAVCKCHNLCYVYWQHFELPFSCWQIGDCSHNLKNFNKPFYWFLSLSARGEMMNRLCFMGGSWCDVRLSWSAAVCRDHSALHLTPSSGSMSKIGGFGSSQFGARSRFWINVYTMVNKVI